MAAVEPLPFVPGMRMEGECYPGHGGQIVHAHDVRAVRDAQRDQGGGAFDPLGRWETAEHNPNRRLAGGAKENGEAQLLEAVELRDELEVLGRCLAKPEAGVD